MDEKLREFLSSHFDGEPTKQLQFEGLYNRVKEITAKLDGPSYLTKTDVATLLALCEIVFSSNPEAEKKSASGLAKGDIVTFQIDGNKLSGEFLGKGPGGRYRVHDGTRLHLMPKEMVNG
tara:strand:+ start:8949 stop:9308 length:360 start_codon:yes stop_codon:yes gene_type:complete